MEHLGTAHWLWLIPVFPLLGAFINGAFGLKIFRRYGEKPIHTLAVLMPSLSFLVTAVYFINLTHFTLCYLVLFINLNP